MPYRNDRIELDISWTAPAGGIAVLYYQVQVTIGGGVYGYYNVNAPTVALTLTNAGNNVNGFANYAGQVLVVSVAAVTAESVTDVNPPASSVLVPQMPPPPAVTNITATLSGGDITYSWTHVADHRTTGYYVQVNWTYAVPSRFVTGPTGTYYFPPLNGTSTYSYSPVQGVNINGGAYSVSVIAYGPGGNASTVINSFIVPGDVVLTTNAFFQGGIMYQGIRADTYVDSFDVYWSANGSGLNYNHTTAAYGGLTAYVGTEQIVGSSGFPRDNNTAYRMIYRPRNVNGTGRYVTSNFGRKMSNPYTFQAQDSATWNNGQWQGDSGGHYVFQGYTPQYGFYWGYGFYGDVINQSLGAGYVGYTLHCTQLNIFMGREGPTTGPYNANYDGPAQPVQILFALHTAADRWGHTESFAGTGAATDSSTNYGFDDYHYAYLPAYWGDDLMQGINGWKGVGIFSPDSTVQYLPPAGTSNSMARMLGHLLSNVHQFFELNIYHDG